MKKRFILLLSLLIILSIAGCSGEDGLSVFELPDKFYNGISLSDTKSDIISRFPDAVVTEITPGTIDEVPDGGDEIVLTECDNEKIKISHTVLCTEGDIIYIMSRYELKNTGGEHTDEDITAYVNETKDMIVGEFSKINGEAKVLDNTKMSYKWESAEETHYLQCTGLNSNPEQYGLIILQSQPK